MATKRKRLATVLGVAIVAVALLVPASAISGGFDAKPGKYERTGTFFETVSFKVTKRDRVKDAQFRLALTSSSYCVTDFAPGGSDKISRRGKFRLSDDKGSLQSWIKGKFVSRTKVKGKMHGERSGCGSSPNVSYEAHHR